ncbi:MAG: hypothetical protein HY966_06735 [Ignavibacteriales bacterium]|nr:hypothetical protein [Ignavibacteriales bacterium]
MVGIRGVFKRRRVWWSDPSFLILLSVLLVVAVPVVWYAAITYDSHLALAIAVFFFLLALLSFSFFKSFGAFSRTVVNSTKVDEASEEVLVGRRETRTEFIAAELSLLRQGQASPVLDIWRLDPALASRHPLFPSIEFSMIYPERREWWIRCGIEDSEEDEASAEERSTLLIRLSEFIRIISRDAYLLRLIPFFDTMVLEVYSYHLSQDNKEVAEPILSFQLASSALLNAYRDTASVVGFWRKKDFLRFDDMKAIQPHRGIEGEASRGGK